MGTFNIQVACVDLKDGPRGIQYCDVVVRVREFYESSESENSVFRDLTFFCFTALAAFVAPRPDFVESIFLTNA